MENTRPNAVTAPATRRAASNLIELSGRLRRNGARAPAYMRGLADGAAYRAQGAPISPYLSVGIDEYALGFRASYYLR